MHYNYANTYRKFSAFFHVNIRIKNQEKGWSGFEKSLANQEAKAVLKPTQNVEGLLFGC